MSRTPRRSTTPPPNRTVVMPVPVVPSPMRVLPSANTAAMYGQNAAMMRAAGARGVGAVTPPRVVPRVTTSADRLEREAAARRATATPARTTNPVNPMFGQRVMASPDTLERQAIQRVATAAGVTAPTIEQIVANAQQRAGITPAAPTGPRPTGGGGTTGGGGGGVNPAAAAAAAAGITGPDMGSFQTILDSIRGAYGQQRTALGQQLDALIAAQGNRRTAAQSAQQAAADQLARILGELQTGATQAGQAVGGVYEQAGGRLGQLMSEYEQMAAQRAAGGGRTLAAFGADASMAQPGGMTAADYLAAERAALGSLGAGEQAYWAARPQAYQGLASDINTQRALQYEALMNQIANAEQQARADIAQQQAGITAAEEQAILDANLRAWQAQQEAALAAQRAAASGGGGGGASFMPIPDVFLGV